MAQKKHLTKEEHITKAEFKRREHELSLKLLDYFNTKKIHPFVACAALHSLLLSSVQMMYVCGYPVPEIKQLVETYKKSLDGVIDAIEKSEADKNK